MYVGEGNWCQFGPCNTGTPFTNKRVQFGSIESCLNKEGIYNFCSIPKLENMRFRITYNGLDGHYILHIKSGDVQFNKDEMILPYIDLNKPQDVDFVKPIRNFLK